MALLSFRPQSEENFAKVHFHVEIFKYKNKIKLIFFIAVRVQHKIFLGVVCLLLSN